MAGLGAKSLDLTDTAIASPDPFLRGAAAEALSFLPAADAAPRRAKLAADPEVVVRLKVLDGLKTAGRRARQPRPRRPAARGPGRRRARRRRSTRSRCSRIPARSPSASTWSPASYADRRPGRADLGDRGGREDARRARGARRRRGRLPAPVDARLAAGTPRAREDASTPIPRRCRGASTRPARASRTTRRCSRQARRPWTAQVETSRGAFTIRLAGDAAPMTVDELRRARAEGLLRRGARPPRRPELRRPGRRSDRDRQRRPGLRDPRRAQPDPVRGRRPSAWRCRARTPAAASGS